MKIITSYASKARLLGTATYSQCTTCSVKAPLSIIELYCTPKFFYLPTIKIKRQFYGICPYCHSKYSIPLCKGKELYRDISTLLLPQDLQSIKNSSESRWIDIFFNTSS